MSRERKAPRFMPRHKYVIYNLCLVLIPVLLLTSLFTRIMIRHVTDEMVQRYSAELEQKRRAIDERLQSFGQMVAYASVDSDLTPFNLRQNSYDTVVALQHMRQLASAQGDAQIFFYVNSDDNLYSPTGKWSRQTFERGYVFRGDWSQADLDELLNTKAAYAAAPLDCSLVTANGAHAYTVIVYPWKHNAVQYGAGLCLIPLAWLESVLYTSQDTPMYAVDSNGRVMGRQGNAGGDFIQAAIQSESDEIRLNGETWCLVRARSQVLGWEYITAVSMNEIKALMYGDRPWIFPAMVVFVLACVALGIMLAMRYYRPVGSLGTLVGREGADIGRVHERVSDIMRRNSEMELSLEVTQDSLMRETAAKLLWSGADEEECKKLLESGAVKLGENPYCVAVLDAGGQTSAEVEKILGSLREESIQATLSPHSGYIAAIVSRKASKTPREVVMGLLEAKQADHKLTVRIGLGSVTDRLSELGRSYIEAVAALKEAALGEVSCFDDILEAQSKLVDKEIALATVRLSEAVSVADENAVNDVCGELEGLLHSAYRETDQVMFRFALNSILKDILPCLERSAPEDFSWKLNLALHALKPEPFIAHLRTLCIGCANANRYRISKETNRVMAQILEYIDANFTDQNLSQAQTAERFDMSTASFSRLFSESLGVLFVDYVSQKRMTYGAELLAGTELSVKEIVAKVGYIDVSSFSRKFTKMFGMNPTAYRRQHEH